MTCKHEGKITQEGPFGYLCLECGEGVDEEEYLTIQAKQHRDIQEQLHSFMGGEIEYPDLTDSIIFHLECDRDTANTIADTLIAEYEYDE